MMIAESITGIARPSDRELLRRAITNARPPRGACQVQRWVCVKNVFGVGSTTATILCREAGLDPDEELSSPPCEGCPLDEEDEENEHKEREGRPARAYMALRRNDLFGAVHPANDDSWLYCQVERVKSDGTIIAYVVNGAWTATFGPDGIGIEDSPGARIAYIGRDLKKFGSDYNAAIEHMRRIRRGEKVEDVIEDPCPECGAELEALWNGVKCPTCNYWYCE